MSTQAYRALFVGHAPAWAKMCQFALSRAGEFDFVESDHQRAMVLLGNSRFDIVINLFTSLDLVTEIRGSTCDHDTQIIIIVHEGTGDYQRDRTACLAAGANAVLTVPLAAQNLIDTVVALLPPR